MRHLTLCVAVVMLCSGCLSEPPVPVARQFPELVARSNPEVAELLDALYCHERDSDNRDFWRKAQAARARLPMIMDEDDVPLVAAAATLGDYRDEGISIKGDGGWKQARQVSRGEFYRIGHRTDWSFTCMGVLVAYYCRTNSPRAQAVFLEVLREMDDLHWSALGGNIERRQTRAHKYNGAKYGAMVLLDGLRKTDFIEAVHAQYLGFEHLESQIEAAYYLYLDGRYKEEAVWFLCRVLKDPEMVLSDRFVRMMEYLRQEVGRTPRENTVAMVYKYLESGIWDDQDYEGMVTYVIPWAKYIDSRRDLGLRWLVRHVLDKDNPHIQGMDLMDELDSIRAGTPVPRQPATVRER